MLLVLLAGPALAGPLQDLVTAAKDGDTVMPPPGIYEEHLVIDKAIVLDGQNAVIIDGGGKGTVVELLSDKATLKNLTIRNSGRLHNALDAALRVKGSNNVIKDLKIENSLFGIDVSKGDHNVIRRNDISSKDMPLELMGDSIRLWYSHFNRVEDNYIHATRDFAVWYSHDNVISGNRIHHTRYGVHFMYAHENEVRNNEIADCVVGVFLMYSNDIIITRNKLLRSWGASGMGMGLKESSGIRAFGNEIVGNAVGIFLDLSPYDPEATNEFEQNQVAYNGIGVEFSTDWEANVFAKNDFNANFSQISVRGGGTALRESWQGNHWDDFAGFDEDRDGRGDSPFEIYSYADRLWMENREANFFRGGFALEALDFVERLAPFSEPKLLLREQFPFIVASVLEEAEKPKDALEMLLQ
ncbi:MAG: nitrous oxide reductase family maturation protein NosD [Phyllobacteriaceae bacterium]|nr:nitrous oxide reductase family maturation protein NosD [Phyllobacteriaceae bacterium]